MTSNCRAAVRPRKTKSFAVSSLQRRVRDTTVWWERLQIALRQGLEWRWTFLKRFYIL